MKSVLIIDDDPRFCALMTASLRTLGATVVIAPSATDGSAEMTRRSFDLIILDGRLPDGDGVAWLQRLREKNSSIPVIFVSASYRDTDSYCKLHAELNVLAVIQKPVQVQQLLEVASGVLKAEIEPAPECSAEALGDDFEQLVKEYQASLPRSLANLNGHVVSLQNYLSIDESYEQAINIAHMIRGTAGSYGFKNLSNLMVVVEEKLRSMQAKGAPSVAGCKSLLNCIAAATMDIMPECNTLPPQMNVRVDRASSNIRVLVVDDDEFFLKRIEHLCASNGMAVTAFSDTRQILSVLDQADPDVILLDLNMPDLNGFNVCKEVRSMPKWQHIPIVVVTAETFPVVETASLQLGATKFVSKPINGKELIDTIHSLVPPHPFVANDC